MPIPRVAVAVVSVVLGGALGAGPARAVPLEFACLTGSDPGDCAIGEAQMDVELTDQGGGVVRFHFRNAGPEASVLARIYFDDGSLLDLSTVVDGPGVDFEADASPPDLPGGDEALPPFQVSEGFLAGSVPSRAQNGAGPEQWVAIDFTLHGVQTLDDVVAELGTGELRIGIHVIAFDSGGSESFVNVPLPEPGTAALLLAPGAAGVAASLRRRHLRVGSRH